MRVFSLVLMMFVSASAFAGEGKAYCKCISMSLETAGMYLFKNDGSAEWQVVRKYNDLPGLEFNVNASAVAQCQADLSEEVTRKAFCQPK